MGCNITQSVVDQAANELSNLFKENAGQMRKAWERTAGNLNVSLSCIWKPCEDTNAIGADLSIKFKMSEVNDRESFVFSDGFGPLFEDWRPPIPTSERQRIIWRDFRELSQAIDRVRYTGKGA